MGGAIAALLASEVRDLEALVLIAPYFLMPWRIKLLSASAPFWSELLGPIEAASVNSILDPVEREANLAYGVVTGRSIRELSLLLKKARNALSQIAAPTLLIQSENDNRIAAEVSRRMFDDLRMDRKKLVMTREGGHIITVDYGRERVFEEVRAWLETGPGTSPQPGRPE